MVWLLRYVACQLDTDGNLVDEFSLGGSDFDIPYSIIQTQDNGYLLTGSAIVKPGGNLECNMHEQADAMLIKLDPELNIEWQNAMVGAIMTGLPI